MIFPLHFTSYQGLVWAWSSEAFSVGQFNKALKAPFLSIDWDVGYVFGFSSFLESKIIIIFLFFLFILSVKENRHILILSPSQKYSLSYKELIPFHYLISRKDSPLTLQRYKIWLTVLDSNSFFTRCEIGMKKQLHQPFHPRVNQPSLYRQSVACCTQ